jgi:hypothetical protein
MLLSLAAFGVASLAIGSAFLTSYAAEDGIPIDLPALSLPRLALPFCASAKPPGPTWYEATRRWRVPVVRAFINSYR